MMRWNSALAVAVLSVATPSAAETGPPTKAVASPMTARAFRPTTFDGKREIVSLVGTLGLESDHLHIAVSDSTGRTIGGHLMETTYGELAIRKR